MLNRAFRFSSLSINKIKRLEMKIKTELFCILAYMMLMIGVLIPLNQSIFLSLAFIFALITVIFSYIER